MLLQLFVHTVPGRAWPDGGDVAFMRQVDLVERAQV